MTKTSKVWIESRQPRHPDCRSFVTPCRQDWRKSAEDARKRLLRVERRVSWMLTTSMFFMTKTSKRVWIESTQPRHPVCHSLVTPCRQDWRKSTEDARKRLLRVERIVSGMFTCLWQKLRIESGLNQHSQEIHIAAALAHHVGKTGGRAQKTRGRGCLE